MPSLSYLLIITSTSMAAINTQDRVGKRSGAVQFEHYQVCANAVGVVSIFLHLGCFDTFLITMIFICRKKITSGA